MPAAESKGVEEGLLAGTLRGTMSKSEGRCRGRGVPPEFTMSFRIISCSASQSCGFHCNVAVFCNGIAVSIFEGMSRRNKYRRTASEAITLGLESNDTIGSFVGLASGLICDFNLLTAPGRDCFPGRLFSAARVAGCADCSFRVCLRLGGKCTFSPSLSHFIWSACCSNCCLHQA